MKIVAQILHYNSFDSLIKVINALNGQTIKLDYIVLLDNGSDAEIVHLIKRLQGISEILYLKNNGVGAGHNSGWKYIIEKYNPDYIWTLEHDAIPRPECLQILLDQIIDDKLVAYHPLEKNNLEYDRFRIYNFNEKGFSFLKDRSLSPNYKGGLSFNGLLFHVSLLSVIGYLNEDYFFGREDIEFARRIYREGGYVLKVTNAIVDHDEYKDKKVFQWGRYMFLLPNPSLSKEYYSYRNAVFDQLKEKRNKALLFFKYFIGVIMVLLIKDRKIKRIYVRSKALRDAFMNKMGKVSNPL